MQAGYTKLQNSDMIVRSQHLLFEMELIYESI